MVTEMVALLVHLWAARMVYKKGIDSVALMVVQTVLGMGNLKDL